MLTFEDIINIIRAHESDLRKFGMVKIGVFGSFVRGDATPESDIDFLVELDPKTFDNYMDLKFYLEELFLRNIDLVLIDSIKPHLREKIENEVVYAA
jgi:predicted nucleotidyltransferase